MDDVLIVQQNILNLNKNSFDDVLISLNFFLKKKNYIVLLRLILNCCLARYQKCMLYSDFIFKLFNSSVIKDKTLFLNILEQLLQNQSNSYFKHIFDVNKDKSHCNINVIDITKAKHDKIIDFIINDDSLSFIDYLAKSMIDINSESIEFDLYKFIFPNSSNFKIIEACAFFGAVKCFKYVMNVSYYKTDNLLACVIAGGNPEIIKLYRESVKEVQYTYNLLVISIRFHHLEVFEWLYEQVNNELKNSNDLIDKCVQCSNYKTFLYLYKGSLKDYIIKNSIEFGDWFLLHFSLQGSINNSVLCGYLINSIEKQQIYCLKEILKIKIKFSSIRTGFIEVFPDLILKCWLSEKYEFAKCLMNFELFDVNVQFTLRRPEQFTDIKYLGTPKSILMIACDSSFESLINELLNIPNININSSCSDPVFQTRNIFDSICKHCSTSFLSKFYHEYSNEIEYNIPFHYSCDSNSITNLKFLLYNTQCSLEKEDLEGRNPLHYSCEIDNTAATEIILQKLKDDDVIKQKILNKRDKNGKTPLLSSCMYQSDKCFNMIYHATDNPPDINDHELLFGNTPLHFASEGNNFYLFKSVMEKNDVEINKQNKAVFIVISGV